LLANESTWSSSEGIEAEFDFKNLPHAGPLGGRLTSEIDSPTEKCCILVDSRSFAPIICLEIPLNYHISPFLNIPIENLQIQLKNYRRLHSRFEDVHLFPVPCPFHWKCNLAVDVAIRR